MLLENIFVDVKKLITKPQLKRTNVDTKVQEKDILIPTNRSGSIFPQKFKKRVQIWT